MALPIPSPPTDNLYKFMAIAGLSFIFGAGIFWANFTTASHEHEMEFLRTWTGTVPPYDYYVPPPRPTDPDAARAQDERLKKLHEDTDRGRARHDRATDAFWKYERFGRAVDALSSVAALIGLVGTIAGFWLWYIRVQRPLDALLSNRGKQTNPTTPDGNVGEE